MGRVAELGSLGITDAMNIFDIIRLAFPIFGALLGYQHHEALHVGVIAGVLIGAVAGYAAGYAVMFGFAALMSLITGQPLFRP